MQKVDLSEENIQKLFGHEAAEDEEPDRLRQYYFKTKVYNQITADLPLRILVGHKGIGKSALFQVAMFEDADKNYIPIMIRPDDVVGVGKYDGDFLQSIRDWKDGLNKIIAEKGLESIGLHDEKRLERVMKHGGRLIAYFTDTFSSKLPVNLDPSRKIIAQKFLKRKKIHVYIDDLDRGWESQKDDIKRISAMLNAIRDLCNENKGLQIKVALRSDVYHLVRTSDESTDKIEGSVVWHSWTNHEIFVMLVKRIKTFFNENVHEKDLLDKRQSELALCLDSVMESRFKGGGHWENAPIHRVLMSLIRKRPRDLVKLCTLAGRMALENDHEIITSKDFEDIFEEYSQGRIQDTINEYKSELPNIEKLLFGMKPNKEERREKTGYNYPTAELLKKISFIMEQGNFTFTNGRFASEKDLAQFMYKINFLTARKDMPNGTIVRKYFEENRYLSSEFADFGFGWEIHPAYRWALQPDRISDIYNSLQLSSD